MRASVHNMDSVSIDRCRESQGDLLNYEIAMEAQQEVDWSSGLPGDLLNYIGTLLAVPGRICFRAVCRTWRAAIEYPAMPTPWAVIPRTEGCSDSFTVLSAPTLNSFQWTPPGGLPARCVGSNAGWLALVTVVPEPKHIRIYLVNPITGARVDLPPTPCWIPDSSPAVVERELDLIVQKLAFAPRPSASAHAAAFASLGGRTVFYARAGINDDDGIWRLLSEIPKAERAVRRELDVAYHGGKFYYMDTHGQVWVADMAAQCPAPVPFASFACPDLPRQVAHRRRGYHLAFSGDGGLHVVWSTSEGDGVSSSNRYHRPAMLVMRYDEASASWAATASVGGDRAFLIGDRSQSLSVPVRIASPWLRADAVYFTNIPLCGLLALGGDWRGVWVFHLAAGVITFPTEDHHKDLVLNELELDQDWPKSVWFMPCMT
ncbi:uncharacterized protein LOC106866008 [Brachypodium distachyon]|nr:uncharacterized protein LOC106866008 [Brachypodium distachyon]|eukprot:XP_024314205.1 uncharacterized protein LOC106866008 [Brachypodium distachyon]